MASTVMRVPFSTGAPLWISGSISTSGHCDQSMVSFLRLHRLPGGASPEARSLWRSHSFRRRSTASRTNSSSVMCSRCASACACSSSAGGTKACRFFSGLVTLPLIVLFSLLRDYLAGLLLVNRVTGVPDCPALGRRGSSSEPVPRAQHLLNAVYHLVMFQEFTRAASGVHRGTAFAVAFLKYRAIELPTPAFACALDALRQAWITRVGYLYIRRENSLS